MFIIDIMMAISNWLWGWPLLILTSAVAVYLSVRFKFFQFTRFGHAMKNTFGKIFDKGDGEGDISPFQACCTALASTLGVGNIAGVSVAIATGGPGAVFWMWAVALMGFIVKFSEITLGRPTGSGILRPADGTAASIGMCAGGWARTGSGWACSGL